MPLARWADYRDDTFLIVGFTERTGLSVARLLQAQSLRYRISEARPRAQIEPLLQGLDLGPGDVLCGAQGPEHLRSISRIIVSPGVPRDLPMLREAHLRGIPVLGDVDFLYPFICHKKLVAVTGTDGKTTTTSLLAAVLARSGKVEVGGNIGIPLCSRYDAILQSDWVVLELSSFMLEQVQRLRADFSVILNIAEDHLDRHGTMQRYAEAKFNIVSHAAAADVFVKNLDDARLSSLSPSGPRVVTMSRSGREADYVLRDGVFQFGGQRLRQQDCRLRGVQHADNILAAAAIGCEAGVAPAAVAEAIAAFQGLPHRFEHAGVHRGVTVVNDSKATTVHAVTRALDNFERGVVLLAGGRDKGLDFSPLAARGTVIKHAVLYGEAAERLRGQLGTLDCRCVGAFGDAVQQAAALCDKGDVLLLSPGCVSWDQFASYEERGAYFKHLAAGLLATQGASRLCDDSRELVPGAAFVAVEGERFDGHRFIHEALSRGAGAVVHRAGAALGVDPSQHPQVTFAAVDSPRELARVVAPAFHGHPSRHLKVVGLTGTNGKTTCSVLLEGMYRRLGHRTGVLNTFGVRYADLAVQLQNVVPEPVRLQRLLADMLARGVDTVLLEASSYALAVGRLHGVTLDTAVFTNITRDHLDVHGTEQRYVEAKLGLLGPFSPGGGAARRCVRWQGCAHRASIDARAEALGCELVGFGVGDRGEQGRLQARELKADLGGTEFGLVWEGEALGRVRTSLLGEYNVRNLLAALSCVLDEAAQQYGRGGALLQWVQACVAEVQVPGRLERVPNGLGATILVDYAHTDDGLRQVLTALRGVAGGRLITVFGCGGDRDRGKRPLMGAVAEALSDVVVVTSDNPRTEEPGAIVEEIVAGMRAGAERVVLVDRQEAIARAVSMLQPGDVLLVAGKGHETTQQVGKQSRTFSDRDIIRKHLPGASEAAKP